MQETEKEFVLDEWLIYPEKSMIKRNDELIHLEPKIMEVLVYLIKNANRVISREELTEKVWQSNFASDEVITRAISVLRKKLDDTGKVHRFVKTIPKHGYVLEYSEQIEAHVLPVFEIDSEANGIEPKINKLISPMWALIIAVVSIVIVVTVIAVTLFNNKEYQESNKIYLKVDDFVALDSLPSSEMVARVLSEQLITTLSNSDYAKISMQTDTIVDTIHDVDFIINGGVKELESEYHVNLHFIDGNSGDVLWSQSFAGDKKMWHQLVNNISKTIDYFISIAYKDNLNLNQLSLKSLQAAILIHQARELRFIDDQNNYNLSINILQNARVSYPNENEIIMELALAYLKNKDGYFSSKHLHSVQQLLEQAEQARYKKGIYRLVKALYQNVNKEINIKQAIALIEKNRLVEPGNVELLAILADLYRINGQDTKAMTLLSNVLAIEPDFSFAIYQRAKLLSIKNKETPKLTTN